MIYTENTYDRYRLSTSDIHLYISKKTKKLYTKHIDYYIYNNYEHKIYIIHLYFEIYVYIHVHCPDRLYCLLKVNKCISRYN